MQPKKFHPSTIYMLQQLYKGILNACLMEELLGLSFFEIDAKSFVVFSESFFEMGNQIQGKNLYDT